MKNTYAVLIQGQKDPIRIQADSFHFSGDSKTALFLGERSAIIAGFPTEKLIGIVADTAIAMKGLTKTPQ